jgi:prevent-host-death family protein
MGRRLSVTEARSQLPLLVKEVAEGNDQIVITTRNEPKAIIIGYDTFQRQQRLRRQGVQHIMIELVGEAQALLQATQESCRGAGEPDLYLFLVNFEGLMRKIWEAAEEVSQAHALIASELLDATLIYLAGEDQLRPEQLEPLARVIPLLLHNNLTMKDAAEADRTLVTHGINAMFPIHGDLVSRYEESAVESE